MVKGGIFIAGLIAGLSPAYALDITPTFDSSVTGASNAAQIESAFNKAAGSIGSLFSNSFTVPILVEAVHAGTNGFLAASESTYYYTDYNSYVGLLAGAAAAHPANTPLNTAIANLGFGNQGGTLGVVATNTVFTALGVPLPGGYDSNGDYVGVGPYDGVILLNIDQPLTYTQPLPAFDGTNLIYDATRSFEHEIDEVLGGGGSGSTLNDVAAYGVDNSNDLFTYLQGALDLYRYSAPGVPSFSTNPSDTAYFSVDGGVTDIVGFNQYSQGDFGDFGPLTDACSGGGFGGPAGLIQDAFSCYNETGEAFTMASPEFKMLEAIGYNAVPEPSSWTMMILGFVGLGFAGHRASRSRRGAFAVQAPPPFDIPAPRA
jgi:hypothetical protein